MIICSDSIVEAVAISHPDIIALSPSPIAPGLGANAVYCCSPDRFDLAPTSVGVAANRACDITVTISNMRTGCFFSFRRARTAPTGHISLILFGTKVKLMFRNAGVLLLIIWWWCFRLTQTQTYLTAHALWNQRVKQERWSQVPDSERHSSNSSPS